MIADDIGFADLEEGDLFAAQAGPPAVAVTPQGACAYQCEAVLLGEILDAYDDVRRHGGNPEKLLGKRRKTEKLKTSE